VVSQRRIEANRRNARKSSGPKSSAGKWRASRNALKHGLAARVNRRSPNGSLLDKLAAEIAGKTDDARILECARAIAAAELELELVRRVRVGLIDGARVFAPDQVKGEKSFLGKGQKSFLGKDNEVASLCGALPELAKLVRYENRAGARRSKAIRRLLQLRLSRTDNLAYVRSH